MSRKHINNLFNKIHEETEIEMFCCDADVKWTLGHVRPRRVSLYIQQQWKK